jgi:hypothetical protein
LCHSGKTTSLGETLEAMASDVGNVESRRLAGFLLSLYGKGVDPALGMTGVEATFVLNDTSEMLLDGAEVLGVILQKSSGQKLRNLEAFRIV